LRRYQPPSQASRDLRALDARRQELKAALRAETNRLEHGNHPLVLKSLKSSMQNLSRMLNAIEAEIERLVAGEADLARKVALARTVPGVGPVVATTLLAHMPQLGSLTRGEAPALAGLAPYDNDSGKMRGRRHIQGGRSAVRRCLYMAALVAMRVCPHLRDFAERIRARGRPFKVAATAVMRKLLVIINAVLASGQPSNYAKPA
jgi:transposase